MLALPSLSAYHYYALLPLFLPARLGSMRKLPSYLIISITPNNAWMERCKSLVKNFERAQIGMALS